MCAGTPNESVLDVLVRMRQVLSITGAFLACATRIGAARPCHQPQLVWREHMALTVSVWGAESQWSNAAIVIISPDSVITSRLSDMPVCEITGHDECMGML